jgi:hypothetical protein
MELTLDRHDRKERKLDTVRRLKNLNWDAVHQAGVVFTEAVADNEITEADMDSLVRLTARLLEFIADAREVLDDDRNSLPTVS